MTAYVRIVSCVLYSSLKICTSVTTSPILNITHRRIIYVESPGSHVNLIEGTIIYTQFHLERLLKLGQRGAERICDVCRNCERSNKMLSTWWVFSVKRVRTMDGLSGDQGNLRLLLHKWTARQGASTPKNSMTSSHSSGTTHSVATECV